MFIWCSRIFGAHRVPPPRRQGQCRASRMLSSKRWMKTFENASNRRIGSVIRKPLRSGEGPTPKSCVKKNGYWMICSRFTKVQIVRRETLAGRPVIVADFKPRRLQAETSEGKNSQHVSGRAWVSEDDHQLARLELDVFEPNRSASGSSQSSRRARASSLKDRSSTMKSGCRLEPRCRSTFASLCSRDSHPSNRRVFGSQEYSVDTILKFPDEVIPQEP